MAKSKKTKVEPPKPLVCTSCVKDYTGGTVAQALDLMAAELFEATGATVSNLIPKEARRLKKFREGSGHRRVRSFKVITHHRGHMVALNLEFADGNGGVVDLEIYNEDIKQQD